MDLTEDEEIALCLILWRRRKKRRARRYWVHPINLLRPTLGEHLKLEIMYSSYPQLFFEYTRLTPLQFDKVLSAVRPYISKQDTNYRNSIDIRIRLQVTLRFLSTGDSMRSIATSFSLGRSTVCKIINETTKSIWKVMSPTQMKELVEEDWEEVMLEFERSWNFPNCLGALDGKHVIIQAPCNSGSMFFNYKNTFSIVLLATCDAKYRFTNVDIGAYGRQSDGGVFSNSILGQKLEQGSLQIPGDRRIKNSNITQPCTFVGDDAFALSSYMMKPYAGDRIVDKKKRIFNYRLSRARRIIENCFGIMASRFRVFRRVLISDPENVCNIIKATVVLHNFLRNEEINMDESSRHYCPSNFVDTDDEDNGLWRTLGENALQPLQPTSKHNCTATAKRMRDNLADFFSDIGSVPWQNQRCGL